MNMNNLVLLWVFDKLYWTNKNVNIRFYDDDDDDVFILFLLSKHSRLNILIAKIVSWSVANINS